MTKLSDATFIIPLKIDSADRVRNIITTVGFLLETFDAKVIIKEVDAQPLFSEYALPQIVEYMDGSIGNLTHVFEKSSDPVFYRMQIINEMLEMVKTDIVFNYDCDVLLQVETYEKASQMIRDGYDIVYPYGFGNYQKQVTVNDEVVSEFLNELDFSVLDSKSNIFDAQYGHVQVLSTKSYFDAGMENENFKGSSPEDKERFYRFNTLGYNVGRIDEYVYHLEHSRGANSWPISAQKNPHMANNFAVWEEIQKMSKDELHNYYDNIWYKNKYNKSVVVSLATPGLGNRIKTYASAMAKYNVVKTCRDVDTSLFQNLDKATHEDLSKYPQVDGWRLEVESEEEDYIKVYKTIDLLYSNTPDYFVEKYQKIFSKFNINPAITNKVNEFSKDWDDVIGLHVRSWYCGRRSWHDNSLFEMEIDKCNPGSKIFLCTDNSDVANHFKQKYGERILQYPQNSYNTSHLAESGHNCDVVDNMNALTDMLLLSKCSAIIGTFGSSFTECAWWFGGCKSKVIIPMPDSIPKEFIDDVFSLK
jgi:hypothetical protein